MLIIFLCIYRRMNKSKHQNELCSESNGNTEKGRNATDSQVKGDDRHKIKQLSVRPAAKHSSAMYTFFNFISSTSFG